MASDDDTRATTPAVRVLLLVAMYYLVLGSASALAWRFLPHPTMIESPVGALFGAGGDVFRGSGKNATVEAMPQGTLAATVALVMIAAALLTLPVAWVYTVTRSKRGYQQSIVQLLIVLPVVIAGVVVLVKYSVALAFSLGGIVAAVRFRNTLDDSKDAVYVFLVTGVGIAAAVDLPVAMVISVLFNLLSVMLWATDFGRTPVAFEGRVAEKRLARARQMARTGTFVARIDNDIFRNMTSEQLDGVARRAWKRAREHDPDVAENGAEDDADGTRLRVTSSDVARTRPIVERKLDDSTKHWKLQAIHSQPDGSTVLEFVVHTKKKTGPDEVLALVRSSCGSDLIDAQIQ
jgi:hypothetical protein